MLIGGNGRVEVTDRKALGVLAADDAYHTGRILVDTVIFRRADNARLINLLQLVGYEFHVFLRKSWNALAEVVEKTLDLFIADIGIHCIVRLELPQQRILLVLDGFIGLVDREIEGGNHRTVHPRFSHIVTELSALIAWQKPDNDGNCKDNENGLGDQIAPIILLEIVEYTHVCYALWFVTFLG